MNVDIIVATYKRYELLQETLNSVAKQSYPHWKCWIAEDGESEETYEAVKPFLKDDRFKYLPGIHAGFPAVPRNRAIKQGNYKIIAILDDDDLWLPNKLECQIDFLKDHPECVLLGCNAYFWDGTENWNKSPLYFKKERLGKISYYKLLSQNYLIHSSLIVSRKAVEQAGLYSEKLDPPIGEDYELCLRVGALGEIWSLPDPYVVYRQTPSTFYKKLDRRDSYRAAVNVFESVLNGVDNVTSPLSYPKNAHLAVACRRKRDFYLAGPRVLGQFRYKLQAKIKKFFVFKGKSES
ncbi:putative N-acetylgalactosaminyl-diphosphoundecaprenol glucuronosyltransferase [Smithella sp. ME-1]|uniref:Putative n-acetylgalactosaminyl-diphosphoundecaprenol glucuronosyltransferase n=1 Tax=hydrocarbon metagenome TaxID=938273 RepID=A0A0W8FNS4_9ZZZZ|nr:putative N-acetylgalactosaminyl-diphosphoundecaprenol glucuronosyltransferase [Smithella sp. ME-1]